MDKFSTNLTGLLFLVFIITSTSISLSQKVKIKKILDSNLFELTDGRLIKLAGIDVPNINHKNENLQEVGISAFKYAKQMFHKKRYELTYPKTSMHDSIFSLVYIIKKYPLQTKDFTKEYLEKGFAKIIPNTKFFEDNSYVEAEQEAKKNQYGIWKFKNNYNSDTLDQTFLAAHFLTDEDIDSITTLLQHLPFVHNASVTTQIILEGFAAPIIGTLTSFGGGLVGFGLGTLLYGTEQGDGLQTAGVFALGGMYIGYTLGNAIGVHFIARNNARDVSLGQSILWSTLGAASGIAIVTCTGNFWRGNILAYTPLFLPGLASIIYANFIAPKKVVKQNISQSSISNTNFIENKLTHKDLYNSTKLLEINLFRINF